MPTPLKSALRAAALYLAVAVVPAAAQDAPVTSRQAAGPSAPATPEPAEPQSWLPQTGAHLAELARTCRQDPPETPPGMRNCYAFQAGIVVSALYFARQANARAPFCLPDGITDARIAGAVADFVAETPDARGYPATGVVIAAMVDRFPCAPDGAPSSQQNSQ